VVVPVRVFLRVFFIKVNNVPVKYNNGTLYSTNYLDDELEQGWIAFNLNCLDVNNKCIIMQFTSQCFNSVS